MEGTVLAPNTANRWTHLAQASGVWLIDALFPRRCLGCGAYGSWCCFTCLAQLSFPRQLHCPGCDAVSPLGEWCEDCLNGQALNGLWVGQYYGNPLVREMIHHFKYDGLTELVKPLGRLLTATLTSFGLPPAWHPIPRADWRLVPVPLNPRRERMRNFNQAKLLANEVAQACGLTVTPVLKRVAATKPQNKLDTTERLSNVRGAFALASPLPNLNGAYILVDDVYTSGATLEECARVLKQAGSREVWGLCVAKG